ncbi:hypothetical protein [Daejeonella sp. H1SJ63]|uniref:hypothetical protein n=1 Tax=Daejeonella sp. H1SJ63 TaxID=3034145 RepID=UPI0023EB0D33|nr:hypothetical protein [Daejeonella sp. H1SJ63]
MKKILVVFMIAFSLSSCEKDQTDASECAIRMKQLFDNELKCTEENAMEVNLYSGKYQNKIVYFPNVMCPVCLGIPPSYGYSCSNEKISFDNFQNVTDIKQVYNSCTKKYLE